MIERSRIDVLSKVHAFTNLRIGAFLCHCFLVQFICSKSKKKNYVGQHGLSFNKVPLLALSYISIIHPGRRNGVSRSSKAPLLGCCGRGMDLLEGVWIVNTVATPIQLNSDIGV